MDPPSGRNDLDLGTPLDPGQLAKQTFLHVVALAVRFRYMKRLLRYVLYCLIYRGLSPTMPSYGPILPAWSCAPIASTNHKAPNFDG